MDAKKFAKGLMGWMFRYQKREGTVNKCLTNAQFLFDSLKESFPHLEVKVLPVMVYIPKEREDTNYFSMGHVVVELDGEILDPSYEINKHTEKQYFPTVQEAISFLPENSISKKQMKKMVSNFLSFVEYAENINNGKILVSDKEYYNTQANYVSLQHKLQNKRK
jgi:hypothetical protein